MKLSYLTESPSIYYFGDDEVVILKDNGNTAFVKVLRGSRYRNGARVELPWNQLRKAPMRQNRRLLQFNDPCPNCGSPGFTSGVECPGCGEKASH